MRSDLDCLGALCAHLKLCEIPYFICHGTMLGLIRDGALIDGDRDIDLGFLHDEISVPLLLEALESAGARLLWKAGKQLPTVLIPGCERPVGLHIYVPFVGPDRQTEMVAAFSRTPRRSLLVRAITALAMGREYDGRYAKFLSVFRILTPLGRALSQELGERGVLWFYGGYYVPKDLLRVRRSIPLGDYEYSVPANAEELLSLVYGPDWQEPNPNFNWSRDSSSVVEWHP